MIQFQVAARTVNTRVDYNSLTFAGLFEVYLKKRIKKPLMTEEGAKMIA